MIKEENEKFAICPICLETLTNNLCFASDDHLFKKNCFSKTNFESPLSRQSFSYYLPVNKAVNAEIYFEKKIKNNFKTIIYVSDGFNEGGYDRKGFDRNAFLINGIDERGSNEKWGISL